MVSRCKLVSLAVALLCIQAFVLICRKNDNRNHRIENYCEILYETWKKSYFYCVNHKTLDIFHVLIALVFLIRIYIFFSYQKHFYRIIILKKLAFATIILIKSISQLIKIVALTSRTHRTHHTVAIFICCRFAFFHEYYTQNVPSMNPTYLISQENT